MLWRWLFVISLLVFGAFHGGWTGVLGMMFVASFLLWLFGLGVQHDPKQVQGIQRTEDFRDDNVIIGVRKGAQISRKERSEDFAAMITDNYGKRKFQ